jgi:hypothetical protein
VILSTRANSATAGIQKAKSSAGSGDLSTHSSLSELREALRGLEGAELEATSAVEFRVGPGGTKEYTGFVCIEDDKQRPRCPHEKLPMNNRALKTMVKSLLDHYGSAANRKELTFLRGGMPQPGYSQVTLEGTGLGLYFENATGKPMGKLTGSL